MIKHKFIKFLLVGLLNTIFGYSLFSIFIYINIHYSIAVLLSTSLGIIFNFKTIGKFVFASSDNSKWIKFLLVYTMLYLLNVFSLRLFELNGFDNMYINGLILLIPLSIISFVLNKYYVFSSIIDNS